MILIIFYNPLQFHSFNHYFCALPQAKELAVKPTNTLALLLEFPTVTPRPMSDLKDASLNVPEVAEPARATRSRLVFVQSFCVVMFYIFEIVKTSDALHALIKCVSKSDNVHPIVIESENTRKRSFVYLYNLLPVLFIHPVSVY